MSNTVEKAINGNISQSLEQTLEQTGEILQDTAKAIAETAANGSHESLADLGSIAAVASLAVILGLIFVRLRQPPIVGYIAAGLLLGPTGLGIVQQSHSITILAELGVLLLLFLIGMEISIRAFVLVLFPAVMIATGQLLAGLSVTLFFGWLLSWSWPQIILLGFIVAVSSTAVAIKVLEDVGELRTETGRITIGVLIAQDIAIVPMLIIAESFGSTGSGFTFYTATLIFGSIVLLGLLIWYLNKPGKITLPFSRYFSGKADLLTLAMLALCFASATISSFFGLSAVYGAFVAGLVVANSTLRSEAIELTYPVQSILVFVFFLSVGLLIDLNYIVDNWRTVGGFVLFVVIAKTLLNILLVRRVGFNWDVAVPSGLAMAQIGEFSFILASVGVANTVLDGDAYRLALSVIAVTLIISPLWMLAIRRFHAEATAGLSTFREALGLVYASELETLQHGVDAVSSSTFVRKLQIYYRAFRIAAKRRRKTKRMAMQSVQNSSNSNIDKGVEHEQSSNHD